MPIDRNVRARAFAFLRAYNACHKQKGQHIGPFTRTCRDILKALLWLTDRNRPACYDAIAAEANCSRDSVWRALVRLRASGLIAWSNCYRWHDQHRKVVRTVNQFRWLEPIMPKSENLAVTLPNRLEKGASQVDGAAQSRLEAAIARFMALKSLR